MLDSALVERLYKKAGSARWEVPRDVFAAALERSARKAAADGIAASGIERYLTSLHLDDLSLACACAVGHDAAWETFIREYRPALHRAADAIDPGGGAREIADSLYAELYGLRDRGGVRRSLFDYFHGRSSLRTWLRAILTQRYTDHVRAGRRLEALPDESSPAVVAAAAAPDPDRARCAALVEQALDAALARLAAPERLLIGCYYAQGMTLAQIGRLVGEHEATVSRRLSRARRSMRDAIDEHLRNAGLGERERDECLASVAADAGRIDLARMLELDPLRKKTAVDRSPQEEVL